MAGDDAKNVRFFGLYTTVQGRVYAFLLMMLHDPNAAEDVLQDTAVTLWEKFDQFREGESFGGWAVSIARLKALEYLRTNRKTKMVFSEPLYLDIASEASALSGDFQKRLSALDTCLGKLNSEHRSLLTQRYKKQLAVKEIAQGRGVSSRQIYQKLSQIFDLLYGCIRRQLAEQDPAV